MKITKENKNIIVNAEVVGMKTNDRCSELTLKYKAYDSEERAEREHEVVVPFINAADKEFPQLADRIVKAGIEVGTHLTVLYVEKENNVYGQNFCFAKGHFFLPETEEKGETNFIQGYVTRINSADGRFSVTIPVDKGQDQTDWLGITFWNNEGQPMADRAAKVIKEGDLIAVYGGPIRETEKGDRVYKNLSGYRFELIQRKSDRKNNSTATEA